MFKVTITDVVSYSNGQYGHETRTAMHRSPKVVWDRIRSGRHCHYTSDSPYGGCPVLQRVQMWRGATLLKDEWD